MREFASTLLPSRQLVADLELPAVDGVAGELRRRVIASPSGSMAAVLSQAARTDILDADLADIAEQAVQPAVRAAAYRMRLAGKVAWLAAREWRCTDVHYRQWRVHEVIGERPLADPPPLLPTLERAAADRSARVRRVAAEALLRDTKILGGAVLEPARRLAADSSPAISERARFILRQMAE